jgi:MoaA/NifB/PqqE/SkfB family radical SAM enzyme
MTDKLQHIAIMITEHCNQNCYHCFRYIAYQKSDLDLDVISKLSEKLKGTSVNSIRFTGGEPLLIKDIDRFIFLFSKLGLHTSIGTNGTLLSLSRIKQLKEAGLNKIWVSIHSCNANKHDMMAGKTGAFYTLLKAINRCIEMDVNINVNFPVSAINIEDAVETLKFLDDIGVNRIKLLRLTPIGKASTKNGFHHITDKKWLDLSEKIKNITFQKTNFKMQGCPPDIPEEGKCTIYPFKHLNLSPSGYIYPCCLLNNRKGMEIGHISELINGNWQQMIDVFSERIRQKYDLSINPIPCITIDETGIEKRLVCPIYFKKVN